MKQLRLFDQRYPQAPGYKESDTSLAAAKEMKSVAQGLRFACLAVLKVSPKTADEVAAELRQNVLAIRPRLSELLRMGAIADTGQRRENESGKLAKVWAAKVN